jgi:hypothetical protein
LGITTVVGGVTVRALAPLRPDNTFSAELRSITLYGGDKSCGYS